MSTVYCGADYTLKNFHNLTVDMYSVSQSYITLTPLFYSPGIYPYMCPPPTFMLLLPTLNNAESVSAACYNDD